MEQLRGDRWTGWGVGEYLSTDWTLAQSGKKQGTQAQKRD